MVACTAAATPSVMIVPVRVSQGQANCLSGIQKAMASMAAREVRLTEGKIERCLDFVDSLWDATGGFHGHWSDDYLDCEHTFYGLLVLGHLSW